jgi:glycosyltransferase involved in cell wall biosynthesis
MILIFETHPIQYKAPIYQRLQQLRPDSFRVIYGSDGSMRDGYDAEFGRKVTWDTPLLEGYPNTVLGNQRGPTLQGFRSLSGRGIFALLRQEKPDAVLVAPFLFAFDAIVFFACKLLRIPVWIRVETQDEAFLRPKWKGDVRTAFYWLAYKGVAHAFYIGSLNREHLGRHGIPSEKTSLAPYASPLAYPADNAAKQRLRDETRAKLGLQPDDIALLFSGKLIDKKNPLLILTALGLLPADLAKRIKIIYVGSGELEPALRREAEKFPGQVQFAGFVNQSEMASHYLAADILVLPSRRMGETWGLVVNEALGAGCGVIMTNAVGCFRDFNNSERVRVIPDNSANACAQAIAGLAKMPRSFDWSAEFNATYSIENAAQALAARIDLATARRPAPRAAA